MTARNKLSFVKKNYQIIYSIILIVFIPLAVIVNTVLFASAFKTTINQETYNKAITVGDTVNAGVSELLTKPDKIQEQIERIAYFNTEIRSLDVLERDGETFKVIASLDKTAVGKLAAAMDNVIAWHQNQPVAFLTTSAAKNSVDRTVSFKQETERFWAVVMPLKNQQNEKGALLSMKLTLAGMDQSIKEVLIRSYVILTITILIIVLLLVNNTRLFEYAALYRKLKEVDQMKDEFISMASHELRTPVTGIRGYTSMILDGTYGEINEKAKGGLKIIASSSERLAILVEDLLNVSRIEQDRIAINLSPSDVSPLVKSIVAELKIQADKKNLTLQYKPHVETLPLINIDSERFKQVLVNLLGNAVKYTMKGSIEILTEEKNGGKELEIKIKDTGIGMSAKARERLFEKFYRIQSEQTRNITGTGLGLWITKRLVGLMGGKIAIDSIESVGTQVTLAFPIVKSARNKKA